MRIRPKIIKTSSKDHQASKNSTIPKLPLAKSLQINDEFSKKKDITERNEVSTSERINFHPDGRVLGGPNPRRFRFHIPLRAKKPHQLRLNDAPREKVRVDGSKKGRVSKFFPLERISPARASPASSQPRNEEKQTRSTRCLSVEERKLRGTRRGRPPSGRANFLRFWKAPRSPFFFFFLLFFFSEERDRLLRANTRCEFYEASHPRSRFLQDQILQSLERFGARD